MKKQISRLQRMACVALLFLVGCHKPPQGDTIFQAATEGRVEDVKWFLDHGGDVSAVDKETGCTPLHMAASVGKLEVVELLLSRGANINAKTIATEMTLQMAQENKVPPISQETPLHRAAAIGQTATLKLLIEKGADINARDSYGATPLHTAASIGRVDAVRMLVDKKADVNAKDKLGRTALKIATNARAPFQIIHALRGVGGKM